MQTLLEKRIVVTGGSSGLGLGIVEALVDDTYPSYFIQLTADNGEIALIRDFRYVPYVTQDAIFRFAG